MCRNWTDFQSWCVCVSSTGGDGQPPHGVLPAQQAGQLHQPHTGRHRARGGRERGGGRQEGHRHGKQTCAAILDLQSVCILLHGGSPCVLLEFRITCVCVCVCVRVRRPLRWAPSSGCTCPACRTSWGSSSSYDSPGSSAQQASWRPSPSCSCAALV